MARRMTYENLVFHAKQRSTNAQREKLQSYLDAGWRVTRVDGLQGYDAVVCICLSSTPAYIDPTGGVTRAAVGVKTVSYKFPKTTISHSERQKSFC